MRLNKLLALQGGLSRRSADQAIADGRVTINGQVARLGQQVTDVDHIEFDGQAITLDSTTKTILLNKPVGYVCSRDGQGSQTIYDLLPPELHNLKPVGRLDKDSSGLLLLTNDGKLAHELTHPSFQKAKRYLVELDKPLTKRDQDLIMGEGVKLEDGNSKLELHAASHDLDKWKIVMREGRNRQIRRTFEALGYRVVQLHRTDFGPYSLNKLASGLYQEVVN